MGNNRVKNRFEVALDAKQVIVLAIGVTVLVAGVFVFGMNLGRRSIIAASPIMAPKDPLARLDEPLPVAAPAPVPEETVELKAHQALTDTRSIDKSLPVPQVKTMPVAISVPPEAALATSPVPPERSAKGAESKGARADSKVALADKAGSLPPVRPERSAKGAESKGRGAKSKTASLPSVRPERSAVGAKSKGAYTIQIASLATRGDAERVAKKNGSRSPRIVTADIPGKGRFYRVVVGSFETQDAAKRQLAVLTRSGVQGIVTAVR